MQRKVILGLTLASSSVFALSVFASPATFETCTTAFAALYAIEASDAPITDFILSAAEDNPKRFQTSSILINDAELAFIRIQTTIVILRDLCSERLDNLPERPMRNPNPISLENCDAILPSVQTAFSQPAISMEIILDEMYETKNQSLISLAIDASNNAVNIISGYSSRLKSAYQICREMGR